MRRAAYASPRSMKVRRIRELVAEAAESGAKVVIFSYFRSVLETVGEALDSGRVTGLRCETKGDDRHEEEHPEDAQSLDRALCVNVVLLVVEGSMSVLRLAPTHIGGEY